MSLRRSPMIQALATFGLFAFLAGVAATGGDGDFHIARFRPVIWLVEDVLVASLGRLEATIALALCGLILAALSYRWAAGQQDQRRR